MNVEMVWLAYDPELLERSWRKINIHGLYMELLQDEFRKRVDPRSLLFHKNQFYLLTDLVGLMKQGGGHLSLEEYLARLFHKGLETLPLSCDEITFDYRLLSYFTSLRMADDFHLVETFYRGLMLHLGQLKEGERFSLVDLAKPEVFFQSLADVRVQQVIDVAQSLNLAEQSKTLVRLVTNYIEFFHYTRNNRLAIFSYNNQTDIRRWGNLLQRKSERDRRVVELTYNQQARQYAKSLIERTQFVIEDDVLSKMRFQRRMENLQQGLSDTDPLIRQKAAEGLGITGNYEAVPALIEALQDDIPEVRQEAARALGVVRDPRCTESLIQLILHDESVAVVRSATQALVQMQSDAGLEAMIELLLRGVYDITVQIAHHPALAKNKTAIHMLLQAMSHPNELIRREVAYILGELPVRASVDKLLQSLNDEDLTVQTHAASSLGRLGSKKALPELYNLRNRIVTPKERWVVEEAIDAILSRNQPTDLT